LSIDPSTALPTNNLKPTETTGVALSLGLTFILIGLFYALPVWVFPKTHPLAQTMSLEILNLYCFVVWMGLAHFAYAYTGQFSSSSHSKQSKLLFLMGLIALGFLLYGLRHWLGYPLFSFLAWIYFFPHFITAELLFNRKLSTLAEENASSIKPYQVFWFPTAAFAYFTFMLFYPKEWLYQPWVLLGTGLVLLLLAYWLGIFKQLQTQRYEKYALLGCFFIGETLVWGTYTQYMNPKFQQGLYFFHVGIASLYHYLRSYFFALQNKPKTNQSPVKRWYWMITNPAIVWINVACITLAMMSLFFQTKLPWLQVISDPQYFTLWVVLHLVASDWFPLLRKPVADTLAPQR
jgi:hypothetical protein